MGEPLEIEPQELASLLTSNKVALIDVRGELEYQICSLPDADVVPIDQLEKDSYKRFPEKDSAIVTYCLSGNRSAAAASILAKLGYTHVCSLKGGLKAWKRLGLPVRATNNLNAIEINRYDRQLQLPEIGIEGQRKLLNSKVLLVGLGGLGSPAAFYLAAAGVGTLGLIDPDIVEESNLQRQILHTTKRVGALKVTSAQETLKAFNPLVRVNTYHERLCDKNAAFLLSQYDLIIDGTDNFVTRTLLNRVCLSLFKPCVFGSVFRFEGQVFFLNPKTNSACYQCLFPNAPKEGIALNCSQAGVLGTLPGMIGLLQANEAMKWILQIGEPLTNRLLVWDGLTSRLREFAVRRDPNCASCGGS